jgi:hypothetical protein
MLPRIGLYYPYVHFRDESWLKVTALYWSKLARIVPKGYFVRDSAVTRALIEHLDFVIDIAPDSAKDDAGIMMLEAITDGTPLLPYEIEVAESMSYRQLEQWEHERSDMASLPIREYVTNSFDGIKSSSNVFGVLDAENYVEALSDEYSSIDPTFAAMMVGRVSRPLAHELTDRRLAFRKGPWLGMHPKVAWIYMCVLAEQIARQNNLIPITDQQVAHSAACEWNSERIIRTLLDTPPYTPTTEVSISALGLLALQIVVPKNLAELPIEKVIKVRERYGADFDAFTTELSSAAYDLRDDFNNISDQAILNAYLNDEVARRFRQPLADLHKIFKGVGIDAAFAAANIKFELPAALTLAGGIISHQPLLAGTGAAAFGVLRTGRVVKNQWGSQAKPSAATYLWRIEREITPQNLVKRLLRR